MSTDQWPIDNRYEDAFGTVRRISTRTQQRLRVAMGSPPSSASFWDQPVLVVDRGRPVRLPNPAELRLEQGDVLRLYDRLPADLPTGYHDLRSLESHHTLRLIVSPGRCYLPEDLHVWGWSAQLYATRSRTSWGIGDLGDLRRLAGWAHRLGAGVLLINPLQAVAPGPSPDPSPYSPSSRRFLNPLYLRIEEIPGASRLGAELARLAEMGQALNAERRIDRGRVLQLKQQALERLWQRFEPDTEFVRYEAREGPALRQFATYCALAEQHGPDWRHWPAAYRRADAPEVLRFAEERRERIRFHSWVQWRLDQQLAHGSHGVRIMHDLPVGFAPGGADAWAWQDQLALDASIGAPPDLFSQDGQDWGLPPFVPHKLRAVGYGPFIETIRATLRHAGGLRIDHVMGLFRLWWVPSGATPREGAYVRYPGDELLAIVALESQRTRAVIVGEDLGTVEADVCERLTARDLLSYRLLWFEEGPPETYPVKALTAVSTHDLPTVAGVWTGADLDRQRRLGLTVDPRRWEPLREKVRAWTSRPETEEVAAVIEATYARLAEVPSAIVLASLDDACLALERPNMPGAPRTEENWSYALPVPLERLESEPLPRRMAQTFAQARAYVSRPRFAVSPRR